MQRLIMNGFIIHYNAKCALVWFCAVDYDDCRTFQEFTKIDYAIKFCCNYQHRMQ